MIYLLVTGALPEIDPASVTLSLAAGQLEFSGNRLEGVRVEWGSAKGRKSDTCNKVTPNQGRETCSIPVGKERPADPSVVRFTWVPAGGRTGKAVRTFDHQGSLTSSNERTFGPNQIVLGRVLQRARSVDVSTGINQPTQASLNIHAWLAYSLGKRTGRLLDEDGTPGEEVRLNPWALIFGPSITIGSLAAFL